MMSAPALDVGALERRERVRLAPVHGRALLADGGLDLGLRHQGREFAAVARSDGGRDAGRGEDRDPRIRLHPRHADARQDGKIGQMRRRHRRRDRERTELAALNLAEHRRDSREAEVDAAADHVLQKRRGPAIRHMDEIDAGLRLEQLHREV
jgi:hypothetical protein